MFLTDALLSILYPQACQICGGSVERQRFGVVCEDCWKKTQICSDRSALGWYEGALRETILFLKRETYLPAHVVELLVVACTGFAGGIRVVAIALHSERLWFECIHMSVYYL